jgi:hypothetical protein
MRIVLLFICVLSFLKSNAQWQSIPRNGTYETAPYRQFIIDPYRNSIWCIQDLKVSVIENSGTIHKFTSTNLGELWTGDNISFVFTPNDIYYNIDVFGLHKFTNYISTPLESSLSNYFNLSSNGDTVYITKKDLQGFVKYYNNESFSFNRNFRNIHAKGVFFYGTNGNSTGIFSYNSISNESTNLNQDPEYLDAIYNAVKFSRHSDTLYVAGKKGISFAFNYDFLDTITPNNTVNMPSSNVLEIEFDHEDKLWAVFGDASDVPFSLAKLEGSTWVNQYDATNSPIDFNNYLGMEIDTLGNVWVVDNMNLHTLLTESSPAWLSTIELQATAKFSLHPNPTNEFIELTTEKPTGEYQLLDAQGRIIKTEKIHSSQQLIDLSTLQSGVYFIELDGKVKRFVKE